MRKRPVFFSSLLLACRLRTGPCAHRIIPLSDMLACEHPACASLCMCTLDAFSSQVPVQSNPFVRVAARDKHLLTPPYIRPLLHLPTPAPLNLHLHVHVCKCKSTPTYVYEYVDPSQIPNRSSGSSCSPPTPTPVLVPVPVPYIDYIL